MRKFIAGVAVAAAGIVWFAGAGPAFADSVTCAPSYGGPVAACATTTGDGGTVRITSASSPGGAVTASASTSGAEVSGDGNESNPAPASGWVIVTASSSGPSVSCGTSGAPDSTAGCP